MRELSLLKKILLASIKKNGNKPLTTCHLVNIITMIEKQTDEEEIERNDFYPDVNS